jgi:hypothetical protein
VEEWFQAYYYGMYWCRGINLEIHHGIHRILKEEIMKNSFEHFRSSIPRGCSCAGIIRNVINGSCFSIERFFVYQAAGKTKLDTFMTKIQASIKQGEIDEAIVSCDKQQGSVAKLNLH